MPSCHEDLIILLRFFYSLFLHCVGNSVLTTFKMEQGYFVQWEKVGVLYTFVFILNISILIGDVGGHMFL